MVSCTDEVVCALIIVVVSILGWQARYCHCKYQIEQRRVNAAEHSLSLSGAAIADMQTRQRECCTGSTR